MEDGLLCTMLACTAGNSWNGVKNMREMLSCESLNISAVMKSKISEGKGYAYFWLDLGEEQNYQIGFFLKDPEESIGRDAFPEEYVYSADEGLLMGIGIYSTLYYVDLEIE